MNIIDIVIDYLHAPNFAKKVSEQKKRGILATTLAFRFLWVRIPNSMT